MTPQGKRLAIVVSHPIQYYVPLYRRLALRDDVKIKVFFTWHAGDAPIHDRGFNVKVAWDIPLTNGFEFELVKNTARDPGTHHFFGLRNPALVSQVMAWEPDVVHITGWAWHSHFCALRTFRKRGVPVLFRGDSHLLDSVQRGIRWWVKCALLRRVYAWPTAFLVVGKANRAYYETLGVDPPRLCPCPHSIDVARFAEPSEALEADARQWRLQLGIRDHCRVLLFAGKFEPKKRPVELMRVVGAIDDPDIALLLVGGGELEGEVNAIASSNPARFRVLPFQNQSRMPVVYRLGDLFVLPSAYGETWGLAVNEAMACGRPVLVSDRVGCAADIVDTCSGRIFSWNHPSAMVAALSDMMQDRDKLRDMGAAAGQRAWTFDVQRTEAALIAALQRVCAT